MVQLLGVYLLTQRQQPDMGVHGNNARSSDYCNVA